MNHKEKKITVGGQAVMEGVMMRGPDRVAVAVRKPDGTIALKIESFQSITKRFRLLAWPILRGAVVLVESLVLGMKSLSFSGDVALANNAPGPLKKRGGFWQNLTLAMTLIFAFALGMALFFYVPILLTDLMGFRTGFSFNLVDGILRLAIFLLYVYLISRWNEIKRVFQYHGAEHKSIYAYEDQKDLIIESAKPYTTLHPRCGTSFLLIVMVVSIVIFMFLGRPDDLGERLLRLAMVPLIGGLSYELIKLSDKGARHPFFRWLIAPGLWLQKMTTREPDDSQIEVALVALKAALGLEPQIGNSVINHMDS